MLFQNTPILNCSRPDPVNPVNYLFLWGTDFRYSGTTHGELTRDNPRGGGDDYKDQLILSSGLLSFQSWRQFGWGTVKSIPSPGVFNKPVKILGQFKKSNFAGQPSSSRLHKQTKRKGRRRRPQGVQCILEGSPSTFPPAKPSKPAPAPDAVPDPYFSSPSQTLGALKRARA